MIRPPERASPALVFGAIAALCMGLGCARKDSREGRPGANADARPSEPLAAQTPSPSSRAGFETTAPSPAEGLTEHRYEPEGLGPSERRPLLMFLHGLGASGAHALEALGLRSLGARERIFISAPEGSIDSAGRRFWNAGPACCNFDGKPIDDVARLRVLIDEWRKHPSVDPTRIYVAGFSNGGFMAHRLACLHGDVISAIVSIAGAGVSERDTCRPKAPISVLHVHGTLDPIVRFAGGTVFNAPDIATHPGARETVLAWGKRLGCPGDPERADPFDLEPSLPGAETERHAFQRCVGANVELWSVHGGKHLIATSERAMNAIWQWLAAR